MRFDVELRTAAFVPRWSIVWTLCRDTVSSHSFFVAIYSNMIADVIKWKGPRDHLLMSALLHDIDETISGDIVSPVKRQILDVERAEDYLQVMVEDRLRGAIESLSHMEDKTSEDTLIESHKIIKAADRMDSLFFLIVDKRRGNAVVDPLIPEAKALLEASWRELPAAEELLDKTWNTVVEPSITDHFISGGRGV